MNGMRQPDRRVIARVATTVAVIAAAISATAACDAAIQDREGGSAFIVNGTDQDLLVTLASGEEVKVPEGRTRGTITVEGCKQIEATATWPDGTVVATLDQELCNDDTWTINDSGATQVD